VPFQVVKQHVLVITAGEASPPQGAARSS